MPGEDRGFSLLLQCPSGSETTGKKAQCCPGVGEANTSLASGAQLNRNRDNEEGLKAFLKSTPWGNLNVSVVHPLHSAFTEVCTES